MRVTNRVTAYGGRWARSAARLVGVMAAGPRQRLGGRGCGAGWLEIVSKRKDSPYRSGRLPDWLKMKNPAHQIRRRANERLTSGAAMNLQLSNEWSTVVSIISAVISVFAAWYAARQARAAKRQADAAHGDVAPTFHVEPHEDTGRPTWGFRLRVRNFNRRPLKIKRIRIRVPTGLIVWEAQDTEPDKIRAILTAAARNRGEVSFEIEQTLDGVSPNASLPTAHDHDFRVGMATGTSEERRTVQINLAIEWEYTSGKASPEVEQMTVDLPIGKDQTSEAR